jgi:hypothetical protein
MKGELRVGLDVRLPVPFRARSTGEKQLAVELVEVDLETVGPARRATDGGYVRDPALVQGGADGADHVRANLRDDLLVPNGIFPLTWAN